MSDICTYTERGLLCVKNLFCYFISSLHIAFDFETIFNKVICIEIGEEPKRGSDNCYTFRIHMLDGKKIQRNFHGDDSIRVNYN